MKRLFYLLIPAIILSSCDSKTEKKTTTTETKKTDSGRVTPVAVMDLQPQVFNANVEVQASINGDEVVMATAKVQGATVQKVLAQVGDHVHQGQVLATLDANVMQEQLQGLEPQLELQKTLYEKQKALWAQNIGTEVQLIQAKTQYEATLRQKSTLQAQRSLYNIVSPIDGTIDAVDIKVGDPSNPGKTGFTVINMNKMKAEAALGENYLGQVRTGNPVTLVFTGIDDSINTKLTYVAESVDPISRAFLVQVKLGSNPKLHPHMSCLMKISNYQNSSALIVPVSVIQKTPNGDMLYIADNGKAKSAYVKLGKNSNGMVEVLTGLSSGGQIITAGFEDLNDGDAISIQK